MTVQKKQVAVVAGATRGAGRGIARALGEAGYAVACTGRSRPDAPSPYKMPETLDETVAMTPNAIAIPCDHTRADDVKAMFERVEKELGPISVIVDSVAGEAPILGGWTGMVDTDLANLDAALQQCLGTRFITATLGARVLRAHGRGLLVEVGEYDLPFGAGGNVISAVVRTAIKALATTLAEELRLKGVTAVTITPGFMRSESVLRHFKVSAENWRDGIEDDEHFAFSETPLFVGRAIVALAADPDAIAKAGQILSSWELAREYGFTDEDGARPDWGEHWRTGVVTTMPELRAGIERQAAWLEQLAKRAREQLGG